MSARKRKDARRGWRKYERLQRAVVALYSAAFWKADRFVENEADMWVELRDAAGIDEGTKTNIVFETFTRQRDEDER